MASKERPGTAQKRWRQKNPQYGRKWRAVNLGKMLYYQARRRAKVAGLPFTLQMSDCVIPECCPILGIPLDRNAGKRDDHLPSLDRVDNSKGYVRGNVCVVSWRANRLKSDGTFLEFVALAAWLQKRIEQESWLCP